MQTWQLSEAEQKLGEVVAEALQHGPQVLTNQGTATAVILSYTDYQRLIGDQQPLSLFFRQSPLVGVDLELERDRSPVREIAL